MFFRNIKKWIFLLSLPVLTPFLFANVAVSAPSISKATFTSAMVGQQPANQLDKLEVNAAKVYFYTNFQGYKGKKLTHQWVYDGWVAQNVSFKVRKDQWPVYSSKTFRGERKGKGKWTVKIINEKGNVIQEETIGYASPDRKTVRKKTPEQKKQEKEEAKKKKQAEQMEKQAEEKKAKEEKARKQEKERIKREEEKKAKAEKDKQKQVEKEARKESKTKESNKKKKESDDNPKQKAASHNLVEDEGDEEEGCDTDDTSEETQVDIAHEKAMKAFESGESDYQSLVLDELESANSVDESVANSVIGELEKLTQGDKDKP